MDKGYQEDGIKRWLELRMCDIPAENQTSRYKTSLRTMIQLEESLRLKLPTSIQSELDAFLGAVNDVIRENAEMYYKHGMADGLSLREELGLREELSFSTSNAKEPEKIYPNTLKAHDVAEIMRCSKAKVYDIIRRPDFPKLTEGRRIFIPRDGFFEWYRRQGQADTTPSPERWDYMQWNK